MSRFPEYQRNALRAEFGLANYEIEALERARVDWVRLVGEFLHCLAEALSRPPSPPPPEEP